MGKPRGGQQGGQQQGQRQQGGGGGGQQGQRQGGQGQRQQGGGGGGGQQGQRQQGGQQGGGPRPQQQQQQQPPRPQQTAWGGQQQAQAAPIPQQSAWGQPQQPQQQQQQAPRPQVPQQSAWGQPQQQQQVPRPQAPPQQTAWGQPQQQQQPPRSQQQQQQPPRPQQQQVQQPPRDIAASMSQLSVAADGNGRGNGNGNGNRGALRGRRVIDSDYLIKSRPANLATKQGTSGKRVQLCANYFKVSETYKQGLNQYHVDFSPELETKYRKQIIARNKERFGGYIFDGTKIYTKLSFDDVEFTAKTNSDELVKVNVKFVGSVHLYDADWLQLFNIIVRKCMDGLKLQLIGRNLFNAMQKITLQEHNLEIWPGYITSMRQHERDLLLCCDIIHKVMRHETVFHILRNLLSQAQQRRTDFKTLAKNELLGSIVLTDYNNKTYRIDDIDFDSNPNSFFSTSKGNVTYVNYYKSRYNIKINDVNQPLLITRPMEKNIRGRQMQDKNAEPQLIKLIPELCRATGITDAMKTDFKLMSAMATHTRVDPENRCKRLQAFQSSLYKTPESSSILNEFNLGIDQNLVEISGHVMPESTVVFGNQRKIAAFDWDQCFKNNSLFQGNVVDNWVVIVPQERHSGTVQSFVKMCQDAGSKMNFRLGRPEVYTLQNDNTMNYSRILEQACQKDPKIIMAFVASPRADLYSCIKKKLVCDRAVPSQVVKVKTAERKNGLMSVATKVVVQMNSKLQCAPWSVMMPDNVMCIGFDVCHSTRDRNKSYGALVASMDVNKKPGVFFSAVSEHIKGNEMSNDIALNVTKALRQYLQEHQKLPSIIFFYRDGVGEGQLHQIYEHEVSFVKKAIEKVYTDMKAVFKLSFIVVSKRINTRIFGNGNGRKTNPEPGTIVDDVITLPQRYDFFLISQSVRQGTVSPTNYNVLFDNTRLPADKIQDMTYRQTHLYYNLFSTVRVPAVCQYAHKLAFLVGQFLHQAPNNLLEKSLYFL